MITLPRQPKYEWQNRLSFNDRQAVVRYYLEGYGLYHIAQVYEVSTTTIEYHLKKFNVWEKNKRPTLFGNVNPIKRSAPIINRTLTKVTVNDNNQFYFDEFGEKYKRPLTYKQILRRYCEIQRRKGAKPKEELKQPTGFIVKVSLTSGACVFKDADGSYNITQSASESDICTSSSSYSW